MKRRKILPALLLAAAPAGVHGQGAAIGDTVFYREETVSETVLRTPSGEVPLSSTHDAVIAWVRVAPDSVHPSASGARQGPPRTRARAPTGKTGGESPNGDPLGAGAGSSPPVEW